MIYYHLSYPKLNNRNQNIILISMMNQRLKPLHTNVIRVLVQNNCQRYQCSSDKVLSYEDVNEIEAFIETLSDDYIYQHPFIYCPRKIQLQKIAIYLSRGDSLYLNVQYTGQIPKSSVIDQISQKFLRNLKFLYCEKLSACFNPFEEHDCMMPGFSIQTIYDPDMCLAIIPVNLEYEPVTIISEAMFFLNYSQGRFLSKDDIVRVDKQKGVIYFRNGEYAELSSLKKIKLNNITGFELCSRLSNYLERIKQSSQKMITAWTIKFDSRFLTQNSRITNPGCIMLSHNVEKSLNDLIFPVARNTYNHYFRLFFKDNNFDDRFEGEIVFLIPQEVMKSAREIIKGMEKIADKMGMKIWFSHYPFSGFHSLQELKKLAEIPVKSSQSIKLLIIPPKLSKQELQNLRQFKQIQIYKKSFLHLLEYDEELERDETDIIAIRHMGIILSIFRLNPWKMRNVPFGNKPTVVVSLDVQETYDGHYSIAMVTSLNSFYSKFTSIRVISDTDRLNDNIFQALKKCLDQFCQSHKLYPFRVFIFRSGFVHHNIRQQLAEIKEKLGRYYVSIQNPNKTSMTYILASKNHPYRTYDQTDENYISQHTVKKTQLLLTFNIAQKHYVQIEFNEPPIEVQIAELQQDPYFGAKVLELTVQLIYSSPGNQFGKGMGFLNYGKKLNQYKDYDLECWSELLSMGFLMFL